MLIVVLTYVALRNLRFIIFRSLGREYILVLLLLSTIMHLINTVSIMEYVTTNNNTITNISNVIGSDVNDPANDPIIQTRDFYANRYDDIDPFLSGLRMWVLAMFFSAMIGRQFMLCKIFNTLKIPYLADSVSSRVQTLWSPLLLSSLLWLPMMAVFFAYQFNAISVIPFLSCFTLYYACYITVFFMLVYHNRKINPIYSDYKNNVVTGVLLIVVVFSGLLVTVLFEFIFVSDFVFELAINYVFGVGFVLPTLVVLGKSCFTFLFRKTEVQAWHNFNKNNGFLYGQVDSESGRSVSQIAASYLASATTTTTTTTTHKQPQSI